MTHIFMYRVTSAGYIEGPPIGPICTLLPNNFHQYVSQDILKSYLSCNVADAETFTKLAGAANIPVITKKKNDAVYQHVMENLTEGGKRAVMEIQPWLFNTLIDWSKEFESYVCSDALPDVDQSVDQFRSEVEIKAPKTSLWSRLATHYLIDLHKKYQNLFQKPSIKKKEVWQKNANDMSHSNFEFANSQCEQKWKNITKAYRSTVDHNRKSGNGKKKECAYFQEL
ncbi:unnamed protein product [Mytilus coruscus]|uniref:Myb/SANT-like DNA-binding domain-containing protein n=1 Tax=Mytilus coruscus TaxID=42192 RepID=A0A6J8EWT2_MYTCO|nr:unnamed protein product [Mytilus coruscus]